MNVVILSHGGLACELLSAAQKIAGDLPEFTALCLSWTDSPEAATTKLAKALEDGREDGWGSLILVDIYGSTPFRTAQRFIEAGKVEVVSGVNLPMVIRLGCLAGKHLDLAETAELLVTKGQQSVCRASEPPAAEALSAEPAAIDPCDPAPEDDS